MLALLYSSLSSAYRVALPGPVGPFWYCSPCGTAPNHYEPVDCPFLTISSRTASQFVAVMVASFSKIHSGTTGMGGNGAAGGSDGRVDAVLADMSGRLSIAVRRAASDVCV